MTDVPDTDRRSVNPINLTLWKDGHSYPFRIGQTFDGDLFIKLEYDGKFIVRSKTGGPANFVTLCFARDAAALTTQENR